MKRLARIFFATSMLFGAGAALAPSIAAARPCCSVCADYPRLCRSGCTPTCVADDAEETARLVYDEQAGLCYIAN